MHRRLQYVLATDQHYKKKNMDILHLRNSRTNLVHIFMTGKHLNEIDASFFKILDKVNLVSFLFIFENVKKA